MTALQNDECINRGCGGEAELEKSLLQLLIMHLLSSLSSDCTFRERSASITTVSQCSVTASSIGLWGPGNIYPCWQFPWTTTEKPKPTWLKQCALLFIVGYAGHLCDCLCLQRFIAIKTANQDFWCLKVTLWQRKETKYHVARTFLSLLTKLDCVKGALPLIVFQANPFRGDCSRGWLLTTFLTNSRDALNFLTLGNPFPLWVSKALHCPWRLR